MPVRACSSKAESKTLSPGARHFQISYTDDGTVAGRHPQSPVEGDPFLR
jgi:hypothetical protein